MTARYDTLQLFIDGEWIDPGKRRTQPVINPATGESIGTLPHATNDDLDRAIAAAEKGFALWRRTSPYDRSKVLRKAADLMRERVEHIATQLTLEEGKTIGEARIEVLASADTFDWYAEEGRRSYGRIVPTRVPGQRHLVMKEPVGVVAAFTPWNFPALTPARKMAGALGAGCSCILKPAEETPSTPLAMARALADAGLPAGVLNIVFGVPSEVSRYLIASPAIRKITFTGSTAVGKELVKLAADGMKRTTMELGGHAPVIVFDDVDPIKVAAACVPFKFRNSGQVCISPTRFYVHEAVHDKFVDAFTDMAKALKIGNGLDADSKMGPLANGRRIEAMDRLIADARGHGAGLRTGGERAGNAGNFWQPTVLTDVPNDARMMNEEPFGAVAIINRFKDFDEMVGQANRLPYGLAAYAFTQSNHNAAAIGEALESGMVGINNFMISMPEAPFGGVKESGHGSEGGIEGLEAYLSTKLVSHM
ncbi:MAG: NAD-dependent succinate-semialdehyde dehydrogenase [Pseudorhodoplanes sp.]